MLQGAALIPQQCLDGSAPNFLQGVNRTARKRHNKSTPNFSQGVIMPTQQCQFYDAPKFLQGSYDVRSNVMQGTPRFLQGAAFCPQKCHNGCAPTSFIWCRDIIAAMLIQKRTKGRAMLRSQQCQSNRALPISYRGSLSLCRNAITSPPSAGVNEGSQKCRFHVTPNSFIWCQLRIAEMSGEQRTKGAIVTTQQCQNPNAPTNFIWCQQETAVMPISDRTKGRAVCLSQKCHKTDALSTQFNGVIVKTQKCLDIVSPREGPPNAHSNVAHASPFPPVIGGHPKKAEMPCNPRPHQIWATPWLAEMPLI